MIVRSEAKRASGRDTAPADREPSPEPTLDELAQKLLVLRQHLDQVLDDLNRATLGARDGDARADESSLRCYACSRIGSTRQAGWTLRLCGDDELHPVCPDCDQRNAAGDSRNGSHSRPISPNGVVTARLPL